MHEHIPAPLAGHTSVENDSAHVGASAVHAGIQLASTRRTISDGIWRCGDRM